MTEISDKERLFLVGLEKLSRETGVTIGGCGCCGSPFAITDEDVAPVEAGYGFGYAGEISWISPSDDYDWENFRDSIVRGESNAGVQP